MMSRAKTRGITCVLFMTGLLATVATGQSPDLRWTFGNVGSSSYRLDSFSPTSVNFGSIGRQDPTLPLEVGKRYEITVVNGQVHPLEILAKGNSAGQDVVLLSMAANGPFESDAGVAWIEHGQGRVSFTLTPALHQAMQQGGRRPGYRCRSHPVDMRADFTVIEPTTPPPTSPPPPQPTVTGACCNPQGGQCYLVGNGICVFPFVYTGDGSNCATCQLQNFTWDFGDAPLSYGVLRSQDGAKHVVAIGVFMGSDVSRDPDGQPGAAANGDDFDDGVLFKTQVVVGQAATVSVTVSISGVINAWLDLNLDGDWLDIGEQIIADRPITAGTSQLTFPVSASAIPGQSYARFRFNRTGGLSHLGEAANGEVEDYAVTILSAGGGGQTPPPTATPTAAAKSPASKYSTVFSQPANVADAGTSRIGGWGIPSDYALGPIVADDWTAGGAQPIEWIRWWGLFNNWTQPTPPSQLPTSFHIGIWSDNPAAPFPATLIWETTASNWSWAYSGQLLDSRGQFGVESVFEFTSLLSQDGWFHPNPVPGTQYWISISAIYSVGQASIPFNWMTRRNQGTSPAVVIQQIGSTLPGQVAQWPPSLGESFQTGGPVNFPAGVPWDMSFELISSGGGQGGIAPGGDLNGDGVVDVQDVSILMGLWLD